jgi:hypothetical protein
MEIDFLIILINGFIRKNKLNGFKILSTTLVHLKINIFMFLYSHMIAYIIRFIDLKLSSILLFTILPITNHLNFLNFHH